MSLINIFPSRQRPTWDQVKSMQDEIDASSKRREEAEVFHDLRDGKQLHRQFELTQTAIRTYKKDLSSIHASISSTQKEIKGLQKLEDHYQKLLAKKQPKSAPVRTPIRGTSTADRLDTRTVTQKQLDAANEKLAVLQTKEAHTKAFLQQAIEGLAVFLAAKPRPHLPTNEQMISDFILAEKLEKEFRDAMNQATPNFFGFAKE
jgi:hypothetical protein